jgi:hypothetical protein
VAAEEKMSLSEGEQRRIEDEVKGARVVPTPSEEQAEARERGGALLKVVGGPRAWKSWRLALAGSFVIVVAAAYLCWPGLNSNPPEYMKEVVSYKEGHDGLVAYSVLADSSGEATTADGKVAFSVFLGSDQRNFDKLIFTRVFEVRKSDFRDTSVGIGAFSRKVTLFSIGRIKYSELVAFNLSGAPQVTTPFVPRSGADGIVSVIFERKDGYPMEGVARITF